MLIHLDILLKNLSEEVTFQIQGNDYVSKNYKLLVHPSPRVFELQSIIDYPNYTNRSNDTIYNNGSFSALYGSKIRWNIECKSTNKVSFLIKDKVYNLHSDSDYFKFSKQLFKTTNYKLSTSNQYVSGLKITII